VTLSSGVHAIGPHNGTLTVTTYAGGVGFMIGHDLVLAASRWRGTLTVDRDEPVGSSADITVDARSLEVVQATGGVKSLSDGDRREIARNRDRTLRTDAHPEIIFRTESVGGDVPDLTATGLLTINGTSRSITLALRVEETGDGTRLSGATRFTQTAFGIRPYSKLGALKVKDEVDVRFTVTLPPGSAGRDR
jgi:polyisoprenoid-binding protein YceI